MEGANSNIELHEQKMFGMVAHIAPHPCKNSELVHKALFDMKKQHLPKFNDEVTSDVTLSIALDHSLDIKPEESYAAFFLHRRLFERDFGRFATEETKLCLDFAVDWHPKRATDGAEWTENEVNWDEFALAIVRGLCEARYTAGVSFDSVFGPEIARFCEKHNTTSQLFAGRALIVVMVTCIKFYAALGNPSKVMYLLKLYNQVARKMPCEVLAGINACDKSMLRYKHAKALFVELASSVCEQVLSKPISSSEYTPDDIKAFKIIFENNLDLFQQSALVHHVFMCHADEELREMLDTTRAIKRMGRIRNSVQWRFCFSKTNFDTMKSVLKLQAKKIPSYVTAFLGGDIDKVASAFLNDKHKEAVARNIIYMAWHALYALEHHDPDMPNVIGKNIATNAKRYKFLVEVLFYCMRRYDEALDSTIFTDRSWYKMRTVALSLLREDCYHSHVAFMAGDDVDDDVSMKTKMDRLKKTYHTTPVNAASRILGVLPVILQATDIVECVPARLVFPPTFKGCANMFAITQQYFVHLMSSGVQHVHGRVASVTAWKRLLPPFPLCFDLHLFDLHDSTDPYDGGDFGQLVPHIMNAIRHNDTIVTSFVGKEPRSVEQSTTFRVPSSSDDQNEE